MKVCKEVQAGPWRVIVDDDGWVHMLWQEMALIRCPATDARKLQDALVLTMAHGIG